MGGYVLVSVMALLLVLGCSASLKEETEMAEVTLVEEPKSVVFITGFDEDDNTYYTNAKDYFKQQNMKVVSNVFSIKGIINWLNTSSKNGNVYENIHIVSHSNAWLGMALKTTKNGERITVESLLKSEENQSIPKLINVVSNNTKIIFHSCGLGENKTLLKALKTVFSESETPTIFASSYFNVFGGKYAGHYLAKPYYTYYPTAESKGPLALSKKIKNKYPNVNINWFKALKTREEVSFGEVYSYKFNVPVNWEISFKNKENIPELNSSDDIMDWIVEVPEFSEALYKLGIPIEDFRWRTKIKGNTLHVKGKSTVLCVLQPILQQNDPTEYRITNIEDKSLYQIL